MPLAGSSDQLARDAQALLNFMGEHSIPSVTNSDQASKSPSGSYAGALVKGGPPVSSPLPTSGSPSLSLCLSPPLSYPRNKRSGERGQMWKKAQARITWGILFLHFLPSSRSCTFYFARELEASGSHPAPRPLPGGRRAHSSRSSPTPTLVLPP